MLNYVGICLVVVIVGLVIAMTVASVCRTVLKELEGYKDRQNQKSMAMITKMFEQLWGGILEAAEKQQEKEVKKREEFRKANQELSDLLDKITEDAKKTKKNTEETEDPDNILEMPIKE